MPLPDTRRREAFCKESLFIIPRWFPHTLPLLLTNHHEELCSCKRASGGRIIYSAIDDRINRRSVNVLSIIYRGVQMDTPFVRRPVLSSMFNQATKSTTPLPCRVMHTTLDASSFRSMPFILISPVALASAHSFRLNRPFLHHE